MSLDFAYRIHSFYPEAKSRGCGGISASGRCFRQASQARNYLKEMKRVSGYV